MNKKILTSLFLLGSFGGLIGCSSDTIVARPSWVDDKIIENVGDKDNKMKNIYDAIKALGDTNSNILNKVLYEIAQKNLGTLDELRQFSKDKSGIDEFVNAHPIYKADDKGVKLNGTTPTQVDLSEDEKRTISQEKIKAQFNAIIETIHEKLFNEIKGGSYSTAEEKLFREEYFVDYLIKNMYTVDKGTIELVKDKLFFPKTKNETWVDYVNYNGTKGFVNLYNTKTQEFTGIYKDYVERNYLPSIYRTLLVETFVRNQRYSNLGRSYARKVNMVTVPRDANYAGNTLDMLHYFADKYITNRQSGVKKADFEDINKALIGFAGVLKEGVEPNLTYELLNTTVQNKGLEWKDRHNYRPVKIKIAGKQYDFVWKCLTNEDGTRAENGEDTNVYEGTKLAELVNKYIKMFDITVDDSKLGTSEAFKATLKKVFDSEAQAAYNDITNNGTIPFETAMYYKERDLRLADITQDGWYLKNGGLTDLPETYREHLFNIETSNIIDNKDKKFEVGDYVGYFGDDAYLLQSNVTTSEHYARVVLDDTKSSFYIVQVEDAVSTSKMSTNISNENSYLYKKAAADPTVSSIEMNKIVREVVKQTAAGDTYKTNAEQYYLMLSNIVFYDQSAYDYFKSQFPDLFK